VNHATFITLAVSLLIMAVNVLVLNLRVNAI
jgi:hypothetical protein